MKLWLPISSPTCKELGSHHYILPKGKKRQKMKIQPLFLDPLERTQDKRCPQDWKDRQVNRVSHGFAEQRQASGTLYGNQRQVGKHELELMSCWSVTADSRLPRCSAAKNKAARQETQVWSLDQEDPLEKGMATHSSILAWRISWTEEPGRLQSMGSQRVRHGCSNWARTHTHTHTHTHSADNSENYNLSPLQMSLPVANFQRCAFHQRQAWVKLHLALCLLWLTIFSSAIFHLLSHLQSITLLASSIDARPCMLAVKLYYCIFQGTLLWDWKCFILCVCFYILFVWKSITNYYSIVLYSRLLVGYHG